jgi:peptidoglycan/LPS O-acetylase OafA/YrhL
MVVVGLLIVYCFWWNARDLATQSWEVGLFLGGMFLAEANMDNSTQTDSLNYRMKLMEYWRYRAAAVRILRICTFLAGLFFASIPVEGASQSPGCFLITSLDQNVRHWQSLGAIITVWSVSNEGLLERLFRFSMVQYLGQVSYTLYLMHGPLLHVLGYAVARDFGLTGGFVVVTPMFFFWIADVFWRLVDIPCQNVGRHIEQWCSCDR